MAIIASIEISQTTDPSSFIITDTTPYAGLDSKSNISSRTLTITDSLGLPLEGYTNPIDFSFINYINDEITITGLTHDMALNIIMTLVPIAPVGGSEYIAEKDIVTNRFLERGLYDIQRARFLSGRLSGKSDNDARISSIDLIIEQQNSNTALQYGSIINAQDALDRGQNIIDNQLI